MVKSFPFVLGVILLVAVVGGVAFFVSSKNKSISDGFVLYKHSQGLFEIIYPEGWIAEEAGLAEGGAIGGAAFSSGKDGREESF